MIEVKAGSWKSWSWQSRGGFLEGEAILRCDCPPGFLGELVFRFTSGDIELEDFSFYICFPSVRKKAKFEERSKRRVVAEACFILPGALSEASLFIERFYRLTK